MLTTSSNCSMVAQATMLRPIQERWGGDCLPPPFLSARALKGRQLTYHCKNIPLTSCVRSVRMAENAREGNRERADSLPGDRERAAGAAGAVLLDLLQPPRAGPVGRRRRRAHRWLLQPLDPEASA